MVIDALNSSPYASQVNSYWSYPKDAGAAQLRSADGTSGIVIAQISGNDSEAPKRAQAIANEVVGENDGVVVLAGGPAISYSQVGEQSKLDLQKAEAIALPITAVILICVFGSLVATAIPIAVAIFAIAATDAALRLLNAFTDVSVFAVNLATPLCLALAIDYSLLIVNRYREEVSAGMSREDAVSRTIAAAGRTVLYSACTVALSLATMLIFPMYFLRSLAYGGLAAVLFSVVGALIVGPALIIVTGSRIESLDIRKPLRRMRVLPTPQPKALEASFWYRVAQLVMRYALPITIAIVAFLILLGLPFKNVNFGYPDDRVLPTSASARQVGESLRRNYPQNPVGAVRIVLPDSSDLSDDRLSEYARDLSLVEGVTGVSAPDATYVSGARVWGTSRAAGERSSSTFLTVSTSLDPFSEEGKNQLAAFKDVQVPTETLFTGAAQQNIDNVAGIGSRIPIVLALIGLASFGLIFLFTGSIVLPLKALAINVLSLTAAFGAIVWVFQEGHLRGLGTTPTGFLAAHIPPLIFCVAFGLSMDYELFVLSRIRDEWLKSSRTTEDNRRAIAVGMARSGRIVTTAAFIMAVVFAAMMTAQIAFTRMLGFGLTLTILMDAFVIRALLVPAFMRLAGRMNWWAPDRLLRWHERRRWISEEADATSLQRHVDAMSRWKQYSSNPNTSESRGRHRLPEP